MPKKFRTGKQEYKHDPLTLRLAHYLAVPPELHIPNAYDFDTQRAPFPMKGWGNFDWGDCVEAGKCNHTLRLERVEHRVTLPITDEDVIAEYKRESERQFGHAPQSAGDQYDNGLVVLDSLKSWRKIGWPVPRSKTKTLNHKIAAFGEVDYHDHTQVKAAIYLMRGVHIGLRLPATAQRQTDDKHWYVVPGNGPDAQPGSWGGHLVYSKRYGPKGVWVMTWGREVLMDWDFLDKYCDEMWVVVDDLDDPATKSYLNVQAMMKHMRDIGVSNVV